MTIMNNNIVRNIPFIGSLMSDQLECQRPQTKVERKFTFSDDDIERFDGRNHFKRLCYESEVLLAKQPPTPYPARSTLLEPLQEHKSSLPEHKSSSQSNLSVTISNDVLFVKLEDSPESHATDLYPSIKVTAEKVDSNCNLCLIM